MHFAKDNVIRKLSKIIKENLILLSPRSETLRSKGLGFEPRPMLVGSGVIAIPGV